MRPEGVAKLALCEPDATTLGVGSDLGLRRAWPRSIDHLHLEYADADGRIMPGQWFRDPRDAMSVESASTPDGGVTTLIPVPEGVVLLQGRGADRKLKRLARLLQTPGAQLISHRPERRAVIRMSGGDAACYGKVVRRSRLGRLEATHALVAGFELRPFHVPPLVRTDTKDGVVWMGAMGGRCLFDAPATTEAMRAVGAALRWLHDADAPADMPVHDAAAERATVERQVELLGAFEPELAARAHRAAARIIDGLGASDSPSGLLHRDFYDKQIFVTEPTAIGVLDFDTLARGERALDIANMLVHIELRTHQGRLDPRAAAAATEAFVAGYAPDGSVRDRIPAYQNAARLRLACLYAFRPTHASIPVRLLEQLEA